MSTSTPATTPPTPPDDSLVQGGPGDQAGASADARDTGRAGSQQGRPQRQEGAAAERRAEDKAPHAPMPPDDQDDRPVSDMERRAGTPDERATTDWLHGEGEPAANETPRPAKAAGRP